MNKILITSTNTIENHPVKKYLGVVCSNIVIGANIFSDISASFVDFFGGKSKSYQKKMESMHHELSKELSHKASLLGANAIVSFRIDFDEISGGGKSMLMATASGTACTIDIKNENEDIQSNDKTDIINNDYLEHEIKRRALISVLKNGGYLKEDFIDFLYEFPQEELCDNLIDRWVNEPDEIIENLLSRLNKATLIKHVYKKLLDYPKQINLLVYNLDLFEPYKTFDILNNGNINIGILLLESSSPTYNRKDLIAMKEIIKLIEALPDKGEIRIVKNIFGKETEKYVCPNGHINNKDFDFCQTCHLNIKGLTFEENKIFESFKRRTNTLDSLL